MSAHRKYNKPTRNLTVTFITEDLQILADHASHLNSVTNMIQTAIRQYIDGQGWDLGDPAGRQADITNKKPAPKKISATADQVTGSDSGPADRPDDQIPEEIRRYMKR